MHDTKVQQWRLLRDGDLPGARNMARDMAILELLATGDSRPTLRLYGWSPPCLSLGRHQGMEAVDLELCRRHGIDVVRRPTGGRAVLHHLELTYSVVAPLGCHPIPGRLQEVYRLLCSPLVDACRSLGIRAQLTPGEVNMALPGPRSSDPCFMAAASGEVVVAGRKLIGSAMRSHRGVVLQHGAILLDWSSRLQAAAMGLADDQALRRSVTTVREQLGRVCRREQLESSIATAFSARLAIELIPGTPSARELQREDELLPSVSLPYEAQQQELAGNDKI